MYILIAGDFAPRARLAKQIEKRQCSEVFSDEIRNVIKFVDFSLVNFECPIVKDGYKPIKKSGPNLRCTKEAAEAIRFAGFTGVTMANNHILDFGAEGLHYSVECCKAQGLNVFGVGRNLDEAEKVFYLYKDGKSAAIINCCEHEFSVATETKAGTNPLNPIRQYYAIREARTKADYVVVIVHGGHEYYQLPSPRMQETYRFFIDAGADVVVNHQQHCYSGYKVYNGKPIFYGLGNFCFDDPKRRTGIWNEGYMVKLSFERQKIGYELIPYTQCNDMPSVQLVKDRTTFEKKLNGLNSIIADNSRMRNEIHKYYKICETFEYLCLEPYTGRIMAKLYSLGLLPSFIKGKKASFIFNHIDCESHRDKLLFALKNKNK